MLEELTSGELRLEGGYSGLTEADLGPWDDSSFHVQGVLAITDGEVAFRAASRNGLVQACATGPMP